MACVGLLGGSLSAFGVHDLKGPMFTQTIAAVTGEDFILRFVATPSTAYIWTLRVPVDDIDLLQSDFEKSTAEAAPGDSGHQIFRMRAKHAGQYELIFDLKRPWEREPIDTCQAMINVLRDPAQQ